MRQPGQENCYVKHIDGPTMVIKREVFDNVKFSNVSRGEDVKFCKDCLQKGIKIYSTNKRYHVYIRHPSSKQHSWPIDNEILLKRYKILKRNIVEIINNGISIYGHYKEKNGIPSNIIKEFKRYTDYKVRIMNDSIAWIRGIHNYSF